MSRYECVADQKAAGFPVNKACEVAEVSTSGFDEMSRINSTNASSATWRAVGGAAWRSDQLDLGSRRLLGYSMADHMHAELVPDALEMAIGARDGVVAGVIAHADRGSQYTSND